MTEKTARRGRKTKFSVQHIPDRICTFVLLYIKCHHRGYADFFPYILLLLPTRLKLTSVFRRQCRIIRVSQKIYVIFSYNISTADLGTRIHMKRKYEQYPVLLRAHILFDKLSVNVTSILSGATAITNDNSKIFAKYNSGSTPLVFSAHVMSH